MLEQPDTFIVSFRYLTGLDSVAPHRIALMGISVGSSVAFVAAADPRINTDVRALIFFGGYHDIVDYLASLATGMSSFNNRSIDWPPSPEAIRHVREILHTAHARGVAQAFAAAAKVRTPEETEALLRSAYTSGGAWPHGAARERLSRHVAVDSRPRRVRRGQEGV